MYLRLAPQWDPIQVRHAAVAFARELARRHPDVVTDAWWKEERGQRIFVDFNQNAPHKTVFGAWCVRARPGAQVSTPFAWDELETIDPDAQTIATVPGRVAERGDPWAEIDTDAPVDRAAARALRPRHRERPDRRALAARVPEDAGRAAPGGAQPGQEAEGHGLNRLPAIWLAGTSSSSGPRRRRSDRPKGTRRQSASPRSFTIRT